MSSVIRETTSIPESLLNGGLRVARSLACSAVLALPFVLQARPASGGQEEGSTSVQVFDTGAASVGRVAYSAADSCTAA